MKVLLSNILVFLCLGEIPTMSERELTQLKSTTTAQVHQQSSQIEQFQEVHNINSRQGDTFTIITQDNRKEHDLDNAPGKIFNHIFFVLYTVLILWSCLNLMY